MSEDNNIYMERIERLINELEYTIVRALEQKSIQDERLGYTKFLPSFNKDNVWGCKFEISVRPSREHEPLYTSQTARLKVVK